MIIIKYSAWLLIFSAFLILVFSILSRKPIKTLFLNAVLGLIALAIVDLTSKFTKVYIPLNEFTVAGSSFLGLPAVIGFIIMQLIFI